MIAAALTGRLGRASGSGGGRAGDRALDDHGDIGERAEGHGRAGYLPVAWAILRSPRRMTNGSMRTQVGIVGAGPAGLLLSHLLHLEGIDSVVLEARSREHVEQRVRAGVLEQGTVDLLCDTGLGDRLRAEGLVHHGVELRFDGRGHRIDLSGLTDGRSITIYGQQEVVKDLIAARLRDGGEILFEVADVDLQGVTSEAPAISYRHDGTGRELRCDVIAGCDGFRGVCRSAVPEDVRTEYDRIYPFGWLGILAECAPSSDELIYARHDRGFALASLRSPRLTRLYLQCEPDEDLDAWPDDRIWDELRRRLATNAGFTLNEGPIVERSWRGCAASCASRCSTAACSWPATPPTSSRPRARRGSTWPWPTCARWPRR